MEKIIEEKFAEWKKTLPKCVSYAGGCDGDLEGLEHEKNCPMYEKKFATHLDAFAAGWTKRGEHGQ